ncbi:hypothetical protein CSX01_05315 [Pseudobutyrivibrio ruminis]|uniref:Uncharacterized protein n=2 Tax=Pseudobutyrivibrio ruminis TaxID=46206 RepID=A0A2G3DWI4_9FIRM|nr:hypothetical protein CSX01_05315 [Pseudobutyrivibrio ruminis]
MYMRKVFCNDRSGFLEKVKIMFTEFDEFLLTCGYFEIRDWNTDSAEVVSSESGHYWIIKKFDKEGYPGLVLYHSHDGRSYHVHFCYKDHDIAPAVSEIMSHDRYQKKKMKLRNKITKVSNRELMMAL